MSALRLLVLVGPHGSGKTTLGRRVAAALGWDFDDEIGERLRREALARDRSAHAMASGEAFDRAVFLRELERDRSRSGRCVVETWHPGNLAYAEHRSPALARAFASKLRGAARAAHGVLVQPLMMRPETLRARLHEPGPTGVADWFHSVGRRAIEIASVWKLPALKPLCTDESDAEATIQQILDRVSDR